MAACMAARNSISVKLVENTGWILDLYAKETLPTIKTIPIVDQHVI